MSGIAGAWNLDGRPVDDAVVRRMGSTIAHRGRDRSGIWSSGSVGVIAHVSSVTPESALERQPVFDDSGNALVFDGRLDNRDELIPQLTGYGVTERSPDSTIVFSAFARWGCECLPHLNGEFALAAFDSRHQRLVLARDPVGCRPLYYWQSAGLVVFGSEIKAVLAHPAVPVRPNDDLIADYFVRERLPYEDTGETFFRNVRAVLPGHQVVIAPSRLSSTTFWDFDTASIVRCASYSDYAVRLRELVFQAVRRRLRSTRPVAIAVSGGLDSSIVLCVADRLRKHDRASPPLLPVCLTPQVGQPPDAERALAVLERTTQLPIQRLAFGAPADESALKNAAWHSEWPRFDDGWVAHRPMFAWANHQGSPTLLSGHWSDQICFVTGYLSDLFLRLRWHEVVAHLREYPRWFVDADPQYFRTRFLRELAFHLTSPQLRRSVRRFVRIGRAHGSPFMAADLVARVGRARAALARPRCRTAHTRAVYQTVRSLARRLQLEADQKLGASCEVEWTTPFLDRDLVAFLMAVPGEIQNRHGVPRALLRESMRGIVPDTILERRWRNEDEITRRREAAYISTEHRLEASQALGFLRQPLRADRETVEFLGLEFWSRAFFSDRLTPLPHPHHGGGKTMDTVDPPRKDDGEKLPYSPPTLTVHGDLRKITAAKQSDRDEAGQPKTFSTSMP